MTRSSLPRCRDTVCRDCQTLPCQVMWSGGLLLGVSSVLFVRRAHTVVISDKPQRNGTLRGRANRWRRFQCISCLMPTLASNPQVRGPECKLLDTAFPQVSAYWRMFLCRRLSGALLPWSGVDSPWHCADAGDWSEHGIHGCRCTSGGVVEAVFEGAGGPQCADGAGVDDGMSPRPIACGR